jgi:hypothetical protein
MGIKKKLLKLFISTGSVWRKYIQELSFWGKNQVLVRCAEQFFSLLSLL